MPFTLDEILPKKNLKFKTYFKYISNDMRVIEGIFKDHQIRFTQPAVLNDPLECNPKLIFRDNKDLHTYYEVEGVTVPSKYITSQLTLIESFYNNIGILSLTKNPFSYDMWNYYANGHKGIVIEFREDFHDYQGFKESKISEPLQKVIYKNPYSINYDELPTEDHCIMDLFTKYVGKYKSTHWQKEKEYRFFRLISSTDSPQKKHPGKIHRDYGLYLFSFDINSIQSIFFGVNTPVELKQMIKEYTHEFDIKLYQSILFRDRNHKMGFIEIDDRNIDFTPQVFIQDSSQYDEDTTRSLQISSREEIPYYESVKEYIDTYIDDRKLRLTKK